MLDCGSRQNVARFEPQWRVAVTRT